LPDTGIALIEFLIGVPIFRMEFPKLAATFAALLTAPVRDLLTVFIVEFAALPIEFMAEVVALLIVFIAEFVAAPIDFILLLIGFPIELAAPRDFIPLLDPILGDLGAEFMTSN
jgi:hypothetical protein